MLVTSMALAREWLCTRVYDLQGVVRCMHSVWELQACVLLVLN